jgi:EAL domain-containing protein (putative c-di-GMP-specific phosphodiesterase class I)
VLGSISKPFSPSQLRALLGQERLDRKAASPVADVVAVPIAHEITEEALREGLEARQFEVYYQPKISCSDGHIAGFEALARWQHPERGMILPDTFIPLAERTGLIRKLTFQVLDIALGWLAAFGDDADFLLAINLSPRSLADMGFANRVFTASWDKGVDPQRVILEVTETSAMADPLTTLDLLTRLRIKGFHLSIDDFGVGYSSMIQLARLPFSEMKIDKSFVVNLAHSDVSQKIVKGIIGLGHSLGLRVTAEGVEDRDALDYLQSVGCDLMQGYLIGRPMSQAEIVDWIAGYDSARVVMDNLY